MVPSRCYFKPSKSRPREGARIAIKDNIDIAGHKTTLCNRSWQDLYPAKAEHAACVQVLIDAGAVIVGKVKLQAMIRREEPLEAVEFTAPFNPRGDGYQEPSGSSHGSAAAIGAYDWLDFSLGSDSADPSGRAADAYWLIPRQQTVVIASPRIIMGALPFAHPRESWTPKESWANSRDKLFQG